MLNVNMTTPGKILYQGPAERVIAPGDAGVFEVLSQHRPLVSRLRPGVLVINDDAFAITRGVLSIHHDTVTAVVELK